MLALSSSSILLLMLNFDEKEMDFKEQKLAYKFLNGNPHESMVKKSANIVFLM